MGQVNYMGGRLNTVKTRNKDTTLQIRKKHFGKQRFKTLSDYLQAINNPVPRAVPVVDPISTIGLAHARLGARGGSRREPSSDSSFSGLGQQRYRSYIPAPSKVSSDPLDVNGASKTKSSTLRILRGLAQVEPASLDYQRKRLLETPDFVGLVALRRRRIEAANLTCISESFPVCGSQEASTCGSDEEEEEEEESMVADYGDTISEYSSLFRDFSGASGESIHSWNDEGDVHKNQLSPSSSIRSFSLSTRHHKTTSPILSERYSDLSQVILGSDAIIEDSGRTEDYAAQIYTSDSVISFSNKRKLQRSPMVRDAIFDPLNIVMSDEWVAFSKMLDTTLYYSQSPSKSLSKIPSQVPEIDSRGKTWPLFRSDMPLGLDFHMLPHLLSERLSQKNNIPTPSWKQTQPSASQDEKTPFDTVTPEQTDEHTTIQSENQNMRADPVSNSAYPAVTNARRRMKLDDAKKLLTDAEPNIYALSDIPSILLSDVPPSHAQLESLSSNSDFLQRSTGSTGGSDINSIYSKRDSRSQWDQLMKELLGPVPSPHRAQISESRSNPDSDSSSHLAISSSDMKSLQVRSSSPLRSLKMNSSNDSIQGDDKLGRVAQNVETKPAVVGLESKRSSRNGRNMDEGSTTPETENISGPILFAFTFTSDREDE